MHETGTAGFGEFVPSDGRGGHLQSNVIDSAGVSIVHGARLPCYSPEIPCFGAIIPCSPFKIPCSVEQGIPTKTRDKTGLFLLQGAPKTAEIAEIPCFFPIDQGI
jgi:hypothetical protein